jgi:hypothetical protein
MNGRLHLSFCPDSRGSLNYLDVYAQGTWALHSQRLRASNVMEAHPLEFTMEIRPYTIDKSTDQEGWRARPSVGLKFRGEGIGPTRRAIPAEHRAWFTRPWPACCSGGVSSRRTSSVR